MQTTRRGFLAVCAAAAVCACGGASMRSVVAANGGQRVAVVSLAINDFAGSLQGWNATRTSDLMTSRAAQMVAMTEQQLAAHWQVVPASSFAGNPAIAAMATAHEVAVPYINGQPMPVVAGDRSALVGARLTPEQARVYAQATGATLFAVVYAEWGVQTGGFIPTSKALSKTVMSIYNAAGQELYHGRADRVGSRTLGAFGRVVVDANSIDEWVGAFGAGIAQLATSG